MLRHFLIEATTITFFDVGANGIVAIRPSRTASMPPLAAGWWWKVEATS
jgi:hypothetical protein